MTDFSFREIIRDEIGKTDLVRIGDLRQILAQMTHSDPEAILQAKDVGRAITVLEVVESDMARVNRAANSLAPEPLERFRAARVEPPNDPCEVWKRRVTTAINLLRGWLQHHEGTSSIKPVNATRAYIGEPEHTPEQSEVRASKQVEADLAKADNALVDALILIREVREADLRESDYADEWISNRKLFLAKYDKPEAT